MRLLGIALTALLVAGCAVVPLEPVAYAPGPVLVPVPAVRVHFVRPVHPHAGYHYSHHR